MVILNIDFLVKSLECKLLNNTLSHVVIVEMEIVAQEPVHVFIKDLRVQNVGVQIVKIIHFLIQFD